MTAYDTQQPHQRSRHKYSMHYVRRIRTRRLGRARLAQHPNARLAAHSLERAAGVHALDVTDIRHAHALAANAALGAARGAGHGSARLAQAGIKLEVVRAAGLAGHLWIVDEIDIADR